MTDQERGLHLINLGIKGNLAQGISRIAMQNNRPVTQDEFDFIDGMPDRTAREISDFCFERGLEPSFVMGIYKRDL